MLIANARMYNSAGPAAKVAWREILSWIVARAGTPMQVIDHDPPELLSELWTRPNLGATMMCGLPMAMRDPRPTIVAAVVPSLARYGGRPVYFSDILVPAFAVWPKRIAAGSVVAVGESRRGPRPTVVVTHGWGGLAAAGRLARRSGAALVVSAAPDVDPALEAWGREIADLIVGPVTPARPLAADVYRDALEKRSGRPVAVAAAQRTYDLVARADGLPTLLLERLLLTLQRVKLLRGATPEVWGAACAGAHVALVGGDSDAVRASADAGCLPIVVAASAEDPRAVAVGSGDPSLLIAHWLQDPAARAARLATPARAAVSARPIERPPEARARPLRLVLNHGGVVAHEMQSSLRPLGWELRPLLGPGRDPMPAADLLVVLPYGDPRGGLEAIRRARRLGVPSVLWNVEDPRYFFDPELGPQVQASAREATITFSTTRQLDTEYRSLGVDLQYLPNFGRGHFLTEEPVADAARTCDVVFLGTQTPQRRQFLDAYRAELGGGASLVVRDDARDPDEQRELVRMARLGLAVGSMTDTSTLRGPLRGEGLTERAFDYPLAWTPVLQDERGHIADHFRDGQEVFVIRDVVHAVAETRRILADSALRARVAEAARRKVLDAHLARHRLITIVEALARQPGASPALVGAAKAARGGA